MARKRSEELTEKIKMPKDVTPGWAEKKARSICMQRNIFDPALNHQKLDELMEEILIRFGFKDLVEFIRAQSRWYE